MTIESQDVPAPAATATSKASAPSEDPHAVFDGDVCAQETGGHRGVQARADVLKAAVDARGEFVVAVAACYLYRGKQCKASRIGRGVEAGDLESCCAPVSGPGEVASRKRLQGEHREQERFA